MNKIQNIRQEEALSKAAVLAEALPWLLRFQDAVVVIKFGGNAMTNSESLKQFAQDVIFLSLAGLKPVVVHGGGPQITKKLDSLGMKSGFFSGFRITSKESITVIKDVLTNEIQQQIVNAINELKPLAIGLSGDENNLLTGKKLVLDNNENNVDLGYVAEVSEVNSQIIVELLKSDKIPVISTLAIGNDMEIYNVNADTAAAAIAISLNASKFVLLTDVAGLMDKYPDESTVIKTIDIGSLKNMLPTIDEGMKPKMQACLAAVLAGVKRAHVIDGRKPHAVLVEVFTDTGTGTMVIEDMDKENE
jgi:acetylglutamate kinase